MTLAPFRPGQHSSVGGDWTPSGVDLVDPIASVSDTFELELDSYVAQLERELTNGMACRAPAVREAARRACFAGAHDVLARLRTGDTLPQSLPPDVAYLARVWALSGLTPEALVAAQVICHERFWERYEEITERVIADPELRWRVYRFVRAQLGGYSQRVLALLRATYTEFTGADDGGQQDHARSALVARVLAGEWIAQPALHYELNQHHVAVVASRGTIRALRALAHDLGAQLLTIPGPDDSLWGWLGRQAALSPRDFHVRARVLGEQAGPFAFGEQASGLAGFRTSHEQALEAWRIARASAPPVVHFAAVASLVALLRDPELAGVFIRHELGELAVGGTRERDLRRVARTYLELGQNAVATASKLGCNRRTVERKLSAIEDAVGHLLRQRSAELLLALQAAPLAGVD